MNRTQALVVSVSLIVRAQVVSAQELSRYRGYALESSVETVVASIGARAGQAQTLHERPAKIQELEWRAPYATQRSGPTATGQRGSRTTTSSGPSRLPTDRRCSNRQLCGPIFRRQRSTTAL